MSAWAEAEYPWHPARSGQDLSLRRRYPIVQPQSARNPFTSMTPGPRLKHEPGAVPLSRRELGEITRSGPWFPVEGECAAFLHPSSFILFLLPPWPQRRGPGERKDRSHAKARRKQCSDPPSGTLAGTGSRRWHWVSSDTEPGSAVQPQSAWDTSTPTIGLKELKGRFAAAQRKADWSHPSAGTHAQAQRPARA